MVLYRFRWKTPFQVQVVRSQPFHVSKAPKAPAIRRVVTDVVPMIAATQGVIHCPSRASEEIYCTALLYPCAAGGSAKVYMDHG